MIALISLSEPGAVIALGLTGQLPDCVVYLHKDVQARPNTIGFERTFDLVAGIFSKARALVFIAPCGVAVRAIAPHLRHKLSDPAVVVVDVGARHAISLLGGHEGGANELALTIANLLDAEPVITTTSEAAREFIVGVGCRRGASAVVIGGAVRSALAVAEVDPARVRYLASADVKKDEAGLIQAARDLGLPLRLISLERIRTSNRAFNRSDFVQKKVNLPAVAEPAALLAGWRTSLILKKTIIDSVTVAIARENFMWSASDPADPRTGPGGPSKP